MKNLLAILAVVLLGTIFANAQVVNNFEVTTNCPAPALTGADASILATITAGDIVPVANLGTGSWTLTAQVGSYTVYAQKTSFAAAAALSGTETWTGFFVAAPNFGIGALGSNTVAISGTANQCGQVVSTTVSLTNWTALATSVAGSYTQTYSMKLTAF